ncbi:MAG: hypothetical protein KF803_02805 [Cyclobacteriaceae bacterium]|nr:hypothetical protein [Cyclobacteriaceae bacterium]
MNGIQEMVFISEIALQSKIAIRAAERLQATQNKSDQVEVWSSIQSMLVASANVSKLLWPRQKYKARGERLRQLLNVNKDNPLADRKFRNYFEHYDEQIEDWFCKQSSAVYTDLSMNPTLRGFSASSDHRGYNTFNNTLIFRGESLDLDIVLKALEELLGNCKPYTLT